MIELGKELQDSFLARRFVREQADAFLPDFLHRPVRAKPSHEFVSGRVQAEVGITKGILEQDGAFPAIPLTLDHHVRPQIDALAGDAVPGFAESAEGLSHTLPKRATTRA